MQIHRITSTGTQYGFGAAIKQAPVVAFELLGDNMLLSWYDRERDLEHETAIVEVHPASGHWMISFHPSNRGKASVIHQGISGVNADY